MAKLPKKVLEMYSETWFPDRLISDRWVSSLFSILLNWNKEIWKEIYSGIIKQKKTVLDF